MVEPVIDANVKEHQRRRQRSTRPVRGVLVLALALVVLVSLGIISATMDGPDASNSYMDRAGYIGSEACGMCHEMKFDMWNATAHHMQMRMANDTTVVSPWDAEVTIRVSEGVDATVNLTVNETGHWIDLDGEGDNVHRVCCVVGGLGWKQLYVTKIGNSRYVLPLQWNLETKEWVAFCPGDWYDTTTGEVKAIAKDRSWDLRCAGCHATGVELAFDQTSGEWTATFSEAGVGCEACHGPGSSHKDASEGTNKKDYIWRSLGSDVCGNCHNRGHAVGSIGGRTPGYPMGADGTTARPGDDLDDLFSMEPVHHPDGETSARNRQQYPDHITHPHSTALDTILGSEMAMDPCLNCHSTDYRMAMSGAKPTMETAMFDIECVICHGPHGTDMMHSLRMPRGQICAQCHNMGACVPGGVPHHPNKEVVMGMAPIDGLMGDPWMGGMVTCTDCHMPMVATNAVAYDIASHSFYVVGPGQSIDHDMPNSCNVRCHQSGSTAGALTDEEAMAFLENNMMAIMAKSMDSAMRVAAAGEAVDEAADLGFSQTVLETAGRRYDNAKFAQDLVVADGTYIHNPMWLNALLDYAAEKSDMVVDDLTPGTVRGMVRDADGKAVSGVEILGEDRVWATTGHDGSFEFDIAPGDHSFLVLKGGMKKATFMAMVSAGETSNAGDIRFEAGEETDDTLYIVIGVIVVILIVVAVVVVGRRGGGGGGDREP